LIEINRKTGTVAWDDFTLHPHLTHDAFVQQYPRLKSEHEYMIGGTQKNTYTFPRTAFYDYFLTPQVDYLNNILSSINFMREYFGDSDDEIYRWRRESPKWAVIAKAWLETQLGQPHKIEPGVLYNEAKIMSPNEIELLQSWEYKFAWGKAGFYYDSLYMPGDVFIHYDYHQQINNWDKLAEECDRRLQNEQERNNGFYVTHLLATRSLIDVLKPNFDFQKAKPYVHATGLSFPILDETIKVVIEVHPNDVANKYKIRREDTTKTSFITEGGNSRLIDELRLFLEAETL
jgi:hypothetical protein